MEFQEFQKIYIGKKISESPLKTSKQAKKQNKTKQKNQHIIFNHVTDTYYLQSLTYNTISSNHLHGFIGKVTEIPKMTSPLMWEVNKGYKRKQIKCYIEHIYFSIRLILQITWTNPLQINYSFTHLHTSEKFWILRSGYPRKCFPWKYTLTKTNEEENKV